MPSTPTPFYWPDWLTVVIALVALVQPWIVAIWKKCFRTALIVRIQEDDPEKEVGGLRFEIENARSTPTSLAPEIGLRYHHQDENGNHVGRNAYYVRDEDRRLEPFRAKIFTASVDRRSKDWEQSFYRIYTFRPTTGLSCRVRIRHRGNLDNLSRVRFAWEYWYFRWFGRFASHEPKDYGDWKRRKRARGPH